MISYLPPRYGYAAFSPYTPPVSALPSDMSYHHAQMLASAALHFPIDAHKRPDYYPTASEPDTRKDMRSPASKPEDSLEKPPLQTASPIVTSSTTSLSQGPGLGAPAMHMTLPPPPPPPGMPHPPAGNILLTHYTVSLQWRHDMETQHWPFVRGINRASHKVPVMRSVDTSFVVSYSKLWNKQSSCRWFETP